MQWSIVGRRVGSAIARAGMYAAMAATIGVAAWSPSPAAAAPDNILGNFGDPVRFLHMFSAADGTTHIEEATLPLRSDGSGAMRTFFYGPAENVRLHTHKSGSNSPWRYARSEDVRNSGHVVILLQGELIITIAEGKTHRVPTGTLMLNDDRAGRGHQTMCVTPDGKDCVILQIDLEDAERKMLLPVRK